MPQVLNHAYLPEGFYDEDDRHTYVGRPSKWGNPYRIGDGNSRAEAIEYYEDHITNQLALGNLDIQELTERNLVCHCAPKPCHAEVLLRLANTHLEYCEDCRQVYASSQMTYCIITSAIGLRICNNCCRDRQSHRTPALWRDGYVRYYGIPTPNRRKRPKPRPKQPAGIAKTNVGVNYTLIDLDEYRIRPEH